MFQKWLFISLRPSWYADFTCYLLRRGVQSPLSSVIVSLIQLRSEVTSVFYAAPVLRRFYTALLVAPAVARGGVTFLGAVRLHRGVPGPGDDVRPALRAASRRAAPPPLVRKSRSSSVRPRPGTALRWMFQWMCT